MIQNYINHIALVVDKSSSMSGLADMVVRVFDKEIDYLKKRSVELKQETRISIYLFNQKVECLVFDMDVMRMESLKGYYNTSGMTALIDGTIKAVGDMVKLPELYGDHAFLVYVMTDGEENSSHSTTKDLVTYLKTLPDNWTLACLVPDAKGTHEAKKFGFSPDNIQIWSTTEVGIETAGKEFRSAIDGYMTMRSQGVRGTKSFFKVDLSGLKNSDVNSILNILPTNDYTILNVRKDVPIKDFVESWQIPYVIGGSYYELNKPETIQAYKEICIQNRKNGKVYSGSNARNLLGLPFSEARVRPDDHGEWRIFVQSTSTNRKLIKGTLLLVRK